MIQRHAHAAFAGVVDERAVLDAIAAAERSTEAIIHVSLAKHVQGEVEHAAAHAFAELGLGTPDRPAVLFFVVPSRRELAVLGSEPAHAKLKDAYWRELVARITADVRERGLTQALVAGIEDAGGRLAQHFPKRDA